MKKLNDEELSRILSQQAVGKLVHYTFGRPASDGDHPECGCIAGAAYDLAAQPYQVLNQADESRALYISRIVNPGPRLDGDNPFASADYPDTPEALLAFLAERGLT